MSSFERRRVNDVSQRADRSCRQGARVHVQGPRHTVERHGCTARRCRRRRLAREQVVTPDPPRESAEAELSEGVRKLPDVTISVRETHPGFFVAELRPASPETHLARGGYV